jgi:hypothetical protein
MKRRLALLVAPVFAATALVVVGTTSPSAAKPPPPPTTTTTTVPPTVATYSPDCTDITNVNASLSGTTLAATVTLGAPWCSNVRYELHQVRGSTDTVVADKTPTATDNPSTTSFTLSGAATPQSGLCSSPVGPSSFAQAYVTTVIVGPPADIGDRAPNEGTNQVIDHATCDDSPAGGWY